jgi:uncharacterized membrane protein (DUF4010 family)
MADNTHTPGAAAWIARVAGGYGGICLLTLVGSLISYPFGTRKFLAPFDDMTWTAPLGRSVWQLSILIIVSFVIWRVAAAIDRDDEFTQYLA